MPDPGPQAPADAEKELSATSRTETFSDGVYAIAMTLLVLALRVPTEADVERRGSLISALLAAWPTYLAYLSTFLTLAVSWISHHGAFAKIARVDTRIQWWNMLVLFAVALAPFPTELLASFLSDGITSGSARTASVLFGIVSALRPLFLLLMWGHLKRRTELLRPGVDVDFATREQRRASVGFTLYGVGAVAGLLSPLAPISASVVASIFFALTAGGRTMRVHRPRPAE